MTEFQSYPGVVRPDYNLNESSSRTSAWYEAVQMQEVPVSQLYQTVRPAGTNQRSRITEGAYRTTPLLRRGYRYDHRPERSQEAKGMIR
jgi:hypothetical protein